MSSDSSKAGDDSSSLQNKLSRIVGHGQEKLRGSVKDWNARKALDAVLMLQNPFRENGKSTVQLEF